MKKILIVLMLFILIGCGAEKKNISIVTPTGAPAFAFYKEKNNQDFETNSTPSNIVALMNEKGKDIVVIDTISGIKAIKNGAPYKLVATLTTGNFFLAATGNDEDGKLDKEDLIILFGEKQTPDLLFHYLFTDEYKIEYVNNVQDAAKCLISGKNIETGNEVDYVFIAEPALTNALKKNEKASVYIDIQEEYKKKNDESLVQASLFIKEGSEVDDYLMELENNINELIDNPDILNEYLTDDEMTLAFYGINPKIVVECLKHNNSLGLAYKKSYENIKAINDYISLFGLNEIDEEIIYK